MEDVEMLAIAVFVGCMAVAVGLVGAIIATKRERKRVEYERLLKLDQAQLPDDDRLRRVERSVEAIAIEMERVSEGQRFVTKLLAETRVRRAETGRPRSPIPPARKYDSPTPTA